MRWRGVKIGIGAAEAKRENEERVWKGSCGGGGGIKKSLWWVKKRDCL